MCEFRVGDIVECVDAIWATLNKGSYYKVVKADQYYVHITKENGYTCEYHSSRFRLVKRENDMTDLTKIDKPFGELPREVQLNLFSAWLDGKTIQLWLKDAGWIDLDCEPSWIPKSKYRLKPKILVPDYINWDHTEE